MMTFTIKREAFDYVTRCANTEKKRNHRSKVSGNGQWRPPDFVCVDGEGTGEGDDHKYVLLGVGQEQYENPDGIHWSEAFEFLYGEFEHRPRAVYVGFFLSYDFNQILKSLPQSRAESLMSVKGINDRRRKKSGGNTVPFPVRCDGWEFDYLPGRRLKIRPEVCECAQQKGVKCTHKQNRWMNICDAGAFWQCSLLNVLNPSRWETPICTQKEYDTILVSKAKRDVAILDDEMRAYNRLENELFARAMQRLAIGLHEIDVHLSAGQWFGPGQAAANWMSENCIPKRLEYVGISMAEETAEYKKWLEGKPIRDSNGPVPLWFWFAAKASYYGGWFEIFSHGIIPETSYEYDLNSAYPHYIRKLPCLLHGTYTRGNGNPGSVGTDDLVLVRVTATADNGVVGALSHRTADGHILRPNRTSGWHWDSEVRAGISSGVIQHVEYHEWARYSPCDCMPPAWRVSNLYERRLSVGKNTVLGIAAKLVYNSMYGKFAQTIGESPYGNWVYASRITSGCREEILHAIGTHPGGLDALLMVATDGVFFDRAHPTLPISSRLGDWDETTRRYLSQFKPGVYWDQATRDAIKNGDPIKFKARGVSAAAFSKQLEYIDWQYFQWHEGADIPENRKDVYQADAINLLAQAEKGWPSVVFVSGFNMTSIVQALQRNDYDQAGQVRSQMAVEQSSTPYEKRCEPYWDKDKQRLRTRPRTLINEQTVYYDKGEASADPFSWRASEMLGVHPDGPGEMPTRNFWNEMVRKMEAKQNG